MKNEREQFSTSLPALTAWALGYAFRRWLGLVAVLGTMLLKNAIELLKPWPVVILVDYALQGNAMPRMLKAIVDSLLGAATNNNLILWCVAATVVVFIFSWVAQMADTYANITFGQALVYDLAADVYAKLQQLSLQFHASKPVGDNIRRVTSDCNCISVIVKDALLPFVSALFALIMMFFILWRIDPLLTLLSIAIAPYMALVLLRYARPMMQRGWQQQEIEGRGFNIVEQTFAAIPVVQAFGQEEQATERLRSNLNENLTATLSLTDVQVRFKLFMAVATAVGTAAVLWIGARHAMAGTMSVGTILLFLSYLTSLYTPLQSIMYTSSIVQSAGGSVQRVLDVLHATEEIADSGTAKELPRVRGDVRFENVGVAYELGRVVLKNVTLHVAAGETIALVGSTGAGKSTLVSLLPRFLDPVEGRVTIDGIDVRDARLKALRSQIAIVTQEPFLFPISIAANIAYGVPHATRQQIEAAARAAGADSFVQKLPQNYDTIIGERGDTLSGGERQRIAIARALLKDAPIVILDEPTSALDAETEYALLHALRELMKQRTVFIIAHRLSTVRWADRIVVLKNGEIVEIGTETELLSRGGVYAGFYNSQRAQTPGREAS